MPDLAAGLAVAPDVLRAEQAVRFGDLSLAAMIAPFRNTELLTGEVREEWYEGQIAFVLPRRDGSRLVISGFEPGFPVAVETDRATVEFSYFGVEKQVTAPGGT